MSYQIKSTPFFRRMLSTSKKNGQLQKLKEEYERMKDFNDRTIEMKMREVRLKRLFKDIEDIKELSYHLPKRSKNSNRNKTAEEIRVETFLKARELGKEFSKLNGLLAPSTSKSSSKEHFSQYPTSETQATQKKRKQLVEKAKVYGNETSKANLIKITNLPRKTPSRKRELSSAPKDGEKLMQRLKYGNSRSHINMAKVQKRDTKHNIANDQSLKSSKTHEVGKQSSLKMPVPPPVLEIPLPPGFDDLERRSSHNLFVQEKESTTHSMGSAVSPLGNNYEAHIRAKKYWRKVALTVLNRFDKAIRCATKVDEVFSDDNTENEFRLRTISNDTDLTSSTTIPEKNNRGGAIDIGPNDPEPNEEDEVLLRVEPLCVTSGALGAHAMPMCTPSTAQVNIISNVNEDQIDLMNSLKDLSDKVAAYEPAPPTSEKVHKLAKIFEPFVREAAQKEAFDGVQKLKSIFESQSE